MIDFNIQRGPSSVLFSEPGVINRRLIIEEGCWYLCTDSAELFLGVRLEDDTLTLKRINAEAQENNSEYAEIIEALRGEINAIKASLNEYAKKSELPDVSNFVTETELENKGYLTEHQDLKDYAKKSEIPNIDGLASEQYVNEAIAGINIPTPDLDDYYTKTEVDEALQNVSVNLEGYATEQFVTDEIAKVNIPDTSDFITMQDVEDKKYLTAVPEGYATESFVHEMIAKAELEDTDVDLDAYYTKEQVDSLIPDVSNFISEIPANYITDEELAEKGYITDISVKADNIPFTTSKFVTNPIGTFISGESITGFTVAELFAKLLGLSDNPTQKPDDFDEPEEAPVHPTNAIEQIIADRLMMYSVNMDNELAAADFKMLQMSPSEAAGAPTTSGFYQIVDNGIVIESGYQELQILNDNTYYIIALPKILDYETMIDLQAYDSDTKTWNVCEKLPMISDQFAVAELCDEVGVDTSHIDTDLYTILVYEDTCVGSKYRYIIKEVN